MRHAIYNMMIGAGVLACLTIHLQVAPPRVMPKDIIDAFTLVLDGEDLEEWYEPPLPGRKPVDGYTDEFRNYMDMLFAEYQP